MSSRTAAAVSGRPVRIRGRRGFPVHDVGGDSEFHQVNTDRNASFSLRS